MKILKAIGAFFAKIWRWIKETAWVQPLLIVGAIFAIIFSIPYFTKWINSMGIGSANYFTGHKLSLEGELEANAPASSPASEVDKITYNLMQNSFLHEDESYTENYNEFGEKYFLVYVESNSTACDEIQSAFEELEQYWDKRYLPVENTIVGHGEKQVLPFAIHTIFIDETSSTDDNNLNNNDSAFQRHLQIYTDFFEDAGTRLQEQTPYGVKNYKSNGNMSAFQKADGGAFSTPTIVLVDYSQEARDLPIYLGQGTGRQGISEILFGLDGATKYEKAQVLLNMWNHTDGEKDNPFTAEHYA